MFHGYANRSGTSSIVAYETGKGYIAVEFENGSVYTYTEDSAGPEAISMMKALAKRGQGLNSFIQMYAKYLYESVE